MSSTYLNADFEQANNAAQDDEDTVDMSDFYAFEELGHSLSTKPQGDGYLVETVDPGDYTPDPDDPDEQAYQMWLAGVRNDPQYADLFHSTPGQQPSDEYIYATAFGASGTGSAQPKTPPMPDFKGVVMYRVWNDLTDHAAHYNSLLREHGYAVVKASLAEAEGDYLFYTYGHEVAERDVRRWVGEVMQQMDATAYHGFTAPPEPEQPEPLNAHYTEANVLTYMRRVVDADWETNTLGLPKKGIKLDKNGRQAYDIMCRLFKAVREAFIDADGFNDGPQEAEDLWVWAGEVLVEKHIIA